MACTYRHGLLARASSHVTKRLRNVKAATYGPRGDFGDKGLILGPGGAGPGRGQPGPRRLILPGQQQQQAPGPRRGGFQPREEEDLPFSAEQISPQPGPNLSSTTTLNRFRPPPGFMNDAPSVDDALSSMQPQDILQKLRARAGAWYNLAKLIPVLYHKGIDSSIIDEETGITPAVQNKWVVAGTVYDSLVTVVPEERLLYFDRDGEHLLYPFRFLSVERRAEAAEYIVENELNETECEVLARAMKEYERRTPQERSGFSMSPADCMAYKHLRDAVECRNEKQRRERVQAGLAVVQSQAGRERLELLLQTSVSSSDGLGGAVLTVLRLSPDELGVRPLPLLSPLGQATLAELEGCPKTSQSGEFGAFVLDSLATTWAWVALPQWKALALARHPAAMEVEDCSKVPSIIAGTRAKSDDDLRRLRGRALVVVDTRVDAVDPLSYVLVPGAGGVLQMVPAPLGSDRAVAQVLFMCRPPVREAVVPTGSMLQL